MKISDFCICNLIILVFSSSVLIRLFVFSSINLNITKFSCNIVLDMKFPDTIYGDIKIVGSILNKYFKCNVCFCYKKTPTDPLFWDITKLYHVPFWNVPNSLKKNLFPLESILVAINNWSSVPPLVYFAGLVYIAGILWPISQQAPESTAENRKIVAQSLAHELIFRSSMTSYSGPQMGRSLPSFNDGFLFKTKGMLPIRMLQSKSKWEESL